MLKQLQDSQNRPGGIVMGGQPNKLKSPSAFPPGRNNDNQIFQSIDNNQRSPHILKGPASSTDMLRRSNGGNGVKTPGSTNGKA